MANEACIQIYKYRGLTGLGRDAVERAIVRNQLYWQSPASFNDPFDCLPVLYFGDNAPERKRFLVTAAARTLGHLPRHERRRSRQEMFNASSVQMEQELVTKWQKSVSESAITCFSEVSDHPLMWAHYSDGHKGVCLIFQEILNEQIQWFTLPVAYQEARPRINLAKIDEMAAHQALCLKSDHWCYEREKRKIAWLEPPGYRDFPPQALKGVILGAKIIAADETFVRLLAAKRPGLEIYRAAIDPTEFRLNIIPA